MNERYFLKAKHPKLSPQKKQERLFSDTLTNKERLKRR
jgi:hypothetical protein